LKSYGYLILGITEGGKNNRGRQKEKPVDVMGQKVLARLFCLSSLEKLHLLN
jgi:hypothetical protein